MSMYPTRTRSLRGPNEALVEAIIEATTRRHTLATGIRDAVRRACRDTDKIRLFLASPMGLALMLGHRWNRLRTTTVYEDLNRNPVYEAAFTIHADRSGSLAQGQGRCRQRATGLPALRRGLLLRPLESTRGPGREQTAADVGVDRVKNPDYSDTLYLSGLVAPDTVNTMPEKTMRAFADHGEIGRPVTGTYADAARTASTGTHSQAITCAPAEGLRPHHRW